MAEPVTAAILAAIAAGMSAGATDTAKKAIGDAYTGLKALLVRKLGAASEAVEAVSQLKKKPESAGWKEDTAKALAKTDVNQDR